VFVTVMVTPGRTAFCWSVTVPEMLPVVPCAAAVQGSRAATAARVQIRSLNRVMVLLLA
jgi:hypothetical protein